MEIERCANCGSDILIRDPRTGELYCEPCGHIQYEPQGNIHTNMFHALSIPDKQEKDEQNDR